MHHVPTMEDTEENMTLLASMQSRSGRKDKRYYLLTVSNCTLAVCLILLGLRVWSLEKSICHMDYSTDFEPIKPILRHRTVAFTSALAFNETSQELYREYSPSEAQFVGAPGPNIDEAWAQLLSGYTFGVTSAEQEGLAGLENLNGLKNPYIQALYRSD
ncbi:hypothetical protein GE09DRAFT_1060439 [Coniochaeta sp. 2T2.1]|nr:hypothetical protein GE09DRAFT_1060439 [Coniochaeta sp. 2T2.1]